MEKQNLLFLPEDVLSKIFIQLPAKQLAQMRCISKYLNAHLSKSDFVKSHLDRSIHNNDAILLVFDDYFSFDSDCECEPPFTAHPSRTPHLQLPNFIKLPVDTHSNTGFTGNVIGSINGLICFRYGLDDNSEVLYIWNPSLSALLTLPPYSVVLFHGSHLGKFYFRFGFDPKTDDYKVIKLTRHADEWLPVEVYSMRKGSWRVITQRIPSHFRGIYHEHEVCVDIYNGHLHWLGCADFEDGSILEMILALDLGAETFSEIPFPDYVRVNRLEVNCRTNSLRVLGGKLCIISTIPNGECEVWVMNEYGVSESWVKHHVFPPFRGDIDPYGFTIHNEFLFRYYPYDFLLYDPVAATTKLFKFRGAPYSKRKVVEYVDSLVWVAPAETRQISSPLSCLRL